MNILITANELRASLPAVVEKVRRGARFTVLYRGRPAFQVVPMEQAPREVGDLQRDSLYHAKPLCSSSDGLRAANHDSTLYPD
jgi:antitoxin (DNA-binding transcriptional repressor) of toxin-antitoxin stability system